MMDFSTSLEMKDERLNEIIAAMRQMQDAMDKLGSGVIIE